MHCQFYSQRALQNDFSKCQCPVFRNPLHIMSVLLSSKVNNVCDIFTIIPVWLLMSSSSPLTLTIQYFKIKLPFQLKQDTIHIYTIRIFLDISVLNSGESITKSEIPYTKCKSKMVQAFWITKATCIIRLNWTYILVLTNTLHSRKFSCPYCL